jgi:hypothetical protein
MRIFLCIKINVWIEKLDAVIHKNLEVLGYGG